MDFPGRRSSRASEANGTASDGHKEGRREAQGRRQTEGCRIDVDGSTSKSRHFGQETVAAYGSKFSNDDDASRWGATRDDESHGTRSRFRDTQGSHIYPESCSFHSQTVCRNPCTRHGRRRKSSKLITLE